MPVEQRIEIITRFVADVRAVLDRTARADHHRWLCARVPCKLDMQADIGIDLPSIIDAGVEMLNPVRHPTSRTRRTMWPGFAGWCPTWLSTWSCATVR